MGEICHVCQCGWMVGTKDPTTHLHGMKLQLLPTGPYLSECLDVQHSAPRIRLTISMAWIVSFSASFHLPWFPYMTVRFPMHDKVDVVRPNMYKPHKHGYHVHQTCPQLTLGICSDGWKLGSHLKGGNLDGGTVREFAAGVKSQLLVRRCILNMLPGVNY